MFHLAAIQWEPAYTQIIDWGRETVSKPPITLTMSDDSIRDIVHTPLSVPACPVHSKAVGRAFQLVSEAAEKVIGVEVTDGYVGRCNAGHSSNSPNPLREGGF